MKPVIHETAVIDPGAVIGEGTVIWHFSHVLTDTVIGKNCRIGQNAVIGPGVTVGSGCKIQNNVNLVKGVTLQDNVFCGPSSVFTNVKTPRAEVDRTGKFMPTVVERGASIGANATVICGITIGSYAMVGAGAVVTSDVKSHQLVTGVPARHAGWACICGATLKAETEKSELLCRECGKSYNIKDGIPSLSKS